MTGIEGLWTCPACGRKLVGRNMAHSCTDATVEDFLRRAGPGRRALYARLESMIAACGPYHVSPAKTRIAFMGRVRFAGVTAIGERGMTLSFALPRPLRSRRFLDVKEIVPGWWAHRLRATRPEDLDEELQGWLRESYRLMGMQERLLERAGSRREEPAAPGDRPRGARRGLKPEAGSVLPSPQRAKPPRKDRR